jgi:hypothetical protein
LHLNASSVTGRIENTGGRRHARDIQLAEKIRLLRRFWRRSAARRPMRRCSTSSATVPRTPCSGAGAARRNRLRVQGRQGRIALLPKLTGTVRILGSVAAGFPTQEEQQEADAITSTNIS